MNSCAFSFQINDSQDLQLRKRKNSATIQQIHVQIVALRKILGKYKIYMEQWKFLQIPVSTEILFILANATRAEFSHSFPIKIRLPHVKVKARSRIKNKET